jgi:hypothetical protein
MPVSISGTNGVTFPDSSLQAAAASPFGLKNRIINGDMRIDQRNAGASVTTNGAFPVDRFIVQNSTDGAFSAQQDTSAPVGFVNSLKYTTTTADGTLTTTQNSSILNRIEGYNVSDLAWGTASAKTVTLSFWVRSSLTGTFGGALRNADNSRSYPFTYTISLANTWEYKTVTIAGDTTGTWLTNNSIGIAVLFGLGAGPNVSGTSGSWASTNYVSATGAVSVIGTLNATFYITGIQLEIGTSATPFERRLYNQELANCQRYYYRMTNANSSYSSFGIGQSTGTTTIRIMMSIPTTMRTFSQSFDVSSTATWILQNSAGSATISSVGTSTNNGLNIFELEFTVSTVTAGAVYALYSNTSAAFVGVSAEL